MARLYLALVAVYMIIAIGVRALIQLKRTGSSGIRGVTGKPGSAEWWAGVLLALVAVGAAVAPLPDALGLIAPSAFADAPRLYTVALALFGVGVLFTFWAQLAMGASWRIGVDKQEVTALVRRGPFAWVRNPIYTAMLVAFAGLMLLMLNVVAIATWLTLFIALELQVRKVEEPHLLRMHGASYEAYAQEVGRFLPLLGRFRAR
jgi:protein-S-isoprenylcysteine O-methyltransferase Ste14